MNATAVLVCRDAELDVALPGVSVAVVDHLCEDHAAAGAALRALGADRVVLGLCSRRASSEHLAALRRAGAAPFGVTSVVIGGTAPNAAALLLRAAVARLEALAPAEHGRPRRPTGEMSRRALFSLASSAVEHAPVAVIDAAACIGTTRCSLCVPACPEQAIDAAGPAPGVDTAACTACGLCVRSCPVGAIRLAGSSLAQVEAQLTAVLPDVIGVIFACAATRPRAAPGWALIELPTLALVTPGWILQMRARGTEVKLVGCGRSCCAGIEEVEALADLIAANASAGDERRDAPVRLAEPFATADGSLALAGPEADLVADHAASPLGVVDLDTDRCTLCGACATACPTRALEFEHTTDGDVLRLAPGACVGCGRCAEVCPEAALGIRRGIDIARLRAGEVELMSAAQERCTRCGSELPPRAMRRRVRELLGRSGGSLELCSRCTVSMNRSIEKERST